MVLWSEKMLDTISVFLNLLRLDLWHNIGSILENVCSLCTWVEFLKTSVRYILSNVSFKACVSLLIFCLDDLSICISGMFKSPNIIVLLSISPFMSIVFALCIEVLLCSVHKYLQLLCFLDPLIVM